MANTKDEQHLQVISICYWVAAGLSALAFAILSIEAVLFAFVFSRIPNQQDLSGPGGKEGPPEWFWTLMTIVVAVLAVMSLTLAILQAVAAVSIQRRTRRTLTLIVAGIQSVASIPLGTVLGVFTFIILSRPSVRDLYEGRLPAQPHQPLSGSPTPPTVPPGML